ncbi:MAG: 3-methyl-2-oxobutanoate hydroxymethyltransferase [Pseudomonadales bacterium]
MAAHSAQTLLQIKQEGKKFCCLTAYDSTFAGLVDEAGIETLLVGDSLGMVLQGHKDTLPVTVDDMAYHIRCVARAVKNTLVIGDLPFQSYATTEQALKSSAQLMRAGSGMVKLEGGEWLSESVHSLTERGMPVCGHLGLTPQSVNAFGGFKVQGRDQSSADKLIADAIILEQAGASLLVVECIPRELGDKVSRALSIPVIGIGAGPDTDAQVLVLHDMLGLGSHSPRFVRDFMQGADSIQAAIAAYAEAVRNGSFPAQEHCFS